MVELARCLSLIPSVMRVDLLTRLIEDPDVDKSYAVPEESLAEHQPHGLGMEGGGDVTGAFIVRLPCGPRNLYLRSGAGGGAVPAVSLQSLHPP